MRRSCINCKNYSYENRYCKEKETNIIDKTGATYCEKYEERRKLESGTVKCCKCNNLNKYGWCREKKRCFNEEEREKERKCIKFAGRNSSKKRGVKNKQKRCQKLDIMPKKV